MINRKLEISASISMILFPILLLAGFLLHPDLTSFEITTTSKGLIDKFYNQPMYHIGHLIVFIAVPFIVTAIFYFMTINVKKGQYWIFWGGILGIIGGVILAGDKGALCIVLSAFDTLNKTEIDQITPALTAIVERRGLLSIFYLLSLLPIGASIQFIGLIKAKKIKNIYGILGITGLLLLNNPDIEIISSIGAVLMCIGYIPMGIKLFKGIDNEV